MDTRQLARFLRVRRAALSPADVGLTVAGRRRTPGLRREEVAGLAGISTDYYTRLEQERATATPSESVLRAVTRALRLSLDERDHLYRLCGLNVPDRRRGDRHVAPALLAVLDRLHDVPAQVMTDLGDTLAQNHLARAVFGDLTGRSGPGASVIYRWFTDPGARGGFPVSDHAGESRALVADLRAAVARRDDDPARTLVDQLRDSSAEFAGLWELHDVAVMRRRRKRILHPEAGLLELDCQSLVDEDRTQVLALFSPVAGTATAERLTLLGLTSRPRP
ncbi:Helix-turn-helix domain-containing protein [Amycolatopsis pretoriensis]|uniref:Helix-turn-helix domain-containing protein n=1 Tax=Amycolatopsis pretoriensis TaxID=218821 RepID=A0A1H5Q5R9_9PSEU|nr:helix-turn-helix transcriptional regulator [Amycolatopsis pretoriensis]SEF20617.1 Helix-turn-helix domain-containing protein [Amycolatopsis pretoriensis]